MMLPREGKLADLLGLLYEGITDNDAWNLFLREVATMVGGESAAFMLGKPAFDLHLVSHYWGQDPDGIRLYCEHYGKLDVWATRGKRIPTSEWLGPSEALCSFDELARTEFFNDFLLRFNAVHALFGAGQYLGGASTNLSVFRGRKRGPFGEGDVDLIRFLSPHIKRALRLHSDLADLKAHTLSLQSTIDSLPTAILLMDRDSRVIAMNLAARTIAGRKDGLLVRHGRLLTERISECAILTKLLSQAAPTSDKNLGRAGAMAVRRKQGASLQVLISPASKLPIRLECPVVAIVFVTDPELKVRPPQEVLTSLFGLTPAESLVALLLTDGHEMRGIAEMLGVKSSTVKSQLSSIYRKTNTSRQSELLRLMMQFAVRVC